MSHKEPSHKCRIAVLDYERYEKSFLPHIQAANELLLKSGSAMDELRVLIANVKERTQREEAMTQFERLHSNVQNNRWHPGAAGLMLELACTDEAKEVPDLMGTVPLWIDILYADWDENHADAVQRFFSFLPDHTLHWASPQEAWRAAVGPDELDDVATAMGALTPRQFSKHLTAAEGGEIFDSEEAEVIASWWSEMRSVIRQARRSEAGILLTVSENLRR